MSSAGSTVSNDKVFQIGSNASETILEKFENFAAGVTFSKEIYCMAAATSHAAKRGLFQMGPLLIR